MKKIKLFFSFILIFSIATISPILFTKDITTAQAASSIYINDKSFTLDIDHYKTIRIKGTTKKATWKSSNSKVASVSSGGKVVAKTPGTTTITANVSGQKITCKVTVIGISKKYLTTTPGKTISLTIVGTKSKGKWSSSNESIVSVDSKGKITTKAPGNATITAYVDGKEITSKVTVVGINYNAYTLELGGWTGYVKTLAISNPTSKITWSSSNKSIATVTSSGKVTAKGTGTATITASVSGLKLTSKITVLKMSTKEFTLKKSNTKKLKINGTTSKITWSSNKNSVATVSSDGTVTPKAAGKAIIIGYVNGIEVTSTVTVVD
ncbi:MAG: hypothetical protein K0S01_2534 [Herbinix sp.]|jgi:chitinase|nr:hypothetical protein [Herbinix sp.]